MPGCGSWILDALWWRGPTFVELRDRQGELWGEVAAAVAGAPHLSTGSTATSWAEHGALPMAGRARAGWGRSSTPMREGPVIGEIPD